MSNSLLSALLSRKVIGKMIYRIGLRREAPNALVKQAALAYRYVVPTGVLLASLL